MLWTYGKQEKCFFIFIFALTLLVRLLLFFCFLSKNDHYLVYFDSAQYQIVAQNIVQGNGISTVVNNPNFYRLPGYPAFLALFFKLFNNNIQATLLVQILISSFIPFLIFFITLTLYPDSLLVAKASALIAALHLGFTVYSGMLATESLFTLFFLFFLLFFLKKRFIASGFTLGIASLIRPVGHFILPVALVLIFLDKKNFSSKIKSASLLTTFWALTVSWWLIRNWLLTGMIFFHTLPGLHFLQYTTAKVVMELRNCSYIEARGSLLDEWKESIKKQEVLLNRSLSEPEKCILAEKITFFYCKQTPFTVIKNCIGEMTKTVFGLYSAQLIFSDTQEWSDYSTQTSVLDKLKKYLFPQVKTWYLIPLTWLEILYSLFLLIGCLFFCLQAFSDKQAARIALQLLPFIVTFLILTCAYGCARLRLPFEPLLLIISLHWWLSNNNKRLQSI